VKELIRQNLHDVLSRRELISGLAGLGMSAVAAKAQSSTSPVMRPTPGETLIYDDFSAGVWPSPRWMKFRSAEYDLWDPETNIRSPGAPENTLTIDLPRFTISHPNHVKALMLSITAFDIEQLHLDPVRGLTRARAIARAEPLRHNALAAELAGVGEDDVAGLVDMLAQLHARPRPLRKQPGEFVLPFFDRDADQIASVQLQEIEGVKVRALLHPIAAPQQVEYGEALLVANDNLAVNQA
jgi:hypothetical protein